MTATNTGNCFALFALLALRVFGPLGPRSLLAWIRARAAHKSRCRWSAEHIPACPLGSSQKWLNHSPQRPRSSLLLPQTRLAPRSTPTWRASGRTRTAWTRCTCAPERCDRRPAGWRHGCCPFHQTHREDVGSFVKRMTVRRWVSHTSWVAETEKGNLMFNFKSARRSVVSKKKKHVQKVPTLNIKKKSLNSRANLFAKKKTFLSATNKNYIIYHIKWDVNRKIARYYLFWLNHESKRIIYQANNRMVWWIIFELPVTS